MVHNVNICICDKSTGEIVGRCRRDLPNENYNGSNPLLDLINRWVLAAVRGREQEKDIVLSIELSKAQFNYVEKSIPF